MDHSLGSGVASSGKVIAVSLHTDGLQPVLHCAYSRGRFGAAWLQQGGVGPGGWRRERKEEEKWKINEIILSFVGSNFSK